MRVGVVGAGVTGLALVHALRERGVDVTAFEAGERPGGVVRSGRCGGTTLEYGPQRLRLTPELADLVDDLGLRDEAVHADPDLPLYVYADGRLRRVPFSVREFLATDLLSWRGKLRVLAEPLAGPGRPDESAHALFARKFGAEAARNLLDPLFGGIYASDPAAMPAGHALAGLLRLEAREGSLLRAAAKRALDGDERAHPVVFRGGNGRLAEALYEAHADRVHLGTPVESVAQRAGDGLVLHTPGATVNVDRVVVTTPADAAADVLANLAPDASERLRRLRYNPLALVFLDAPLDRDGLGYQVRDGEPLRTLGVSWNGVAFDRGDLCTCFLGGMGDQGILDGSDDRLAAVARREFEAVTGASARVLDVARLDPGIPAYDESWRALDGLELPDCVHLATNYTARVGVPGRVREARALADRLAAGRA